MNFYKEKNYEREHLRAPYKEELMFKDGEYVFKAKASNISVGGMLLENVNYFPKETSNLQFFIKLPSFPYFKSFDFEKLQSYSTDLLEAKVIRLKCEMVRKSTMKTKIDEILASNIGLRIIEINNLDKELIKDYVNIFSSNLIYLQTLIDDLNGKPNLGKYIRELGKILGYEDNIKISLLNKQVISDYRSLQWL